MPHCSPKSFRPRVTLPARSRAEIGPVHKYTFKPGYLSLVREARWSHPGSNRVGIHRFYNELDPPCSKHGPVRARKSGCCGGGGSCIYPLQSIRFRSCRGFCPFSGSKSPSRHQKSTKLPRCVSARESSNATLEEGQNLDWGPWVVR